jgi:hypothetical protein
VVMGRGTWDVGHGLMCSSTAVTSRMPRSHIVLPPRDEANQDSARMWALSWRPHGQHNVRGWPSLVAVANKGSLRWRLHLAWRRGRSHMCARFSSPDWRHARLQLWVNDHRPRLHICTLTLPVRRA